ncbi:MAG: hypothetical protein WC794_04570 [Candidatus Doudnabacteria bacterium]|jgi:hypothetical protein
MSEIESPIHNIKPPELALELAKAEMKEKEKNEFETALLKRIVEAYLASYKNASEKWSRIAESGTQFEKDFAAHIKAKEESGEIPKYEQAKIITDFSQRLKAVFEYNTDGSVKSFSFDFLYPDMASSMAEDEDLNYIRQVADIGDYSIQFASGGLPVRNQELIKETDLSDIPLRHDVHYIEWVNTEKIWQEEANKNPDGAKYFLEEIILKEESDLHIALRNLNDELRRVEEWIVEKRKKGGVVGGLRSRCDNLTKIIKEYSGYLDGLIRYQKKRLPGV